MVVFVQYECKRCRNKNGGADATDRHIQIQFKASDRLAFMIFEEACHSK